MIHFHYMRKARFAGGKAYCMGGDSPQNATTTTQNYDNRAITTTNVNDLSNRSINSTLNDLSDNSTTLNDLSNHSVNNMWDQSATNSGNTTNTTTNISYTDGGAVAAAVALAKSIAGSALDSAVTSQVHAYDYADGVFDSALDFVNNNDSRALAAFDRAATIANDALVRAGSLQTAALVQVQGAYADAKGTTQAQQKIILAVLAVAGVALIFRARG